MTAKAKAKELFYKHKTILAPHFMIRVTLDRYAKQCALIAVDEIINVLGEISLGESGTTNMDYGQSFFTEVKDEINKL